MNERISRDWDHAEIIIAEAYQVIGILLHHGGWFNTDDATLVLDHFSGKPCEELLPWPKSPLPNVERAAVLAWLNGRVEQGLHGVKISASSGTENNPFLDVLKTNVMVLDIVRQAIERGDHVSQQR